MSSFHEYQTYQPSYSSSPSSTQLPTSANEHTSGLIPFEITYQRNSTQPSFSDSLPIGLQSPGFMRSSEHHSASFSMEGEKRMEYVFVSEDNALYVLFTFLFSKILMTLLITESMSIMLLNLKMIPTLLKEMVMLEKSFSTNVFLPISIQRIPVTLFMSKLLRLLNQTFDAIFTKELV